MRKPNDLSRSPAALNEDTTLVAVIEMGLASRWVAGRIPGVDRHPLIKQDPDPQGLLARLLRWRDEAMQAGRTITRIAVAYEAGRDGFSLARWLRARGVESYVIHPTSIPVKRDHRRGKTDRLASALLMRAFLGWLRGEPDHCSMAAISTLEEEDCKRPNREHQKLAGEKTRIISRVKGTLARLGIRNFKGSLRYAAQRLKEMRRPEGVAIPPNTMAELERNLARPRFIREQSREIERARLARLEETPENRPHATVLMLAKVRGIGIETADMLVNEILARNLRDRRAVARYAGMTGPPDESGAKRREKRLAKAGNSRVRRGMLQLAWRWLMFQEESAWSKWYMARTGHAPERTRKMTIVALARKLLIALWRYTTHGEIPEGIALRLVG